MSSSDDYHRHRLRTATKYFKVSVKPFQRLGRVRGGSPGKVSWRGAGRQPRKKGLAGNGAAAPGKDLFYAFMLNFCKEYIVCTLFAIEEEKIKTTHENINDSHTEKKKNCCSAIGRTI